MFVYIVLGYLASLGNKVDATVLFCSVNSYFLLLLKIYRPNSYLLTKQFIREELGRPVIQLLNYMRQYLK